ncbi:MAG TPA: biopolymer transporter ExbD [Pirellulaceae bacterium]|nr:biopolymer transporter ExbD [Pirellulaceae bacterium]
MSVRFSCPQCGKQLKAREADAGRTTACSGCGTKIVIPSAEGAAPDAEAAAGLPETAAGEDDEPMLPMPPRRPAEDLIDMTAMVDIVFFLLIFFLVTSLQAVLAVINLPTPQAAVGTAASRSIADLTNDPDYIVVRIEDDDSIWVEDAQAFNDQEIRVKLRSAADELGRPPSILVIGNADASNGAAVRVFDACAYAKVKNVSFLVQEGDVEQAP